jgi:hypothetical protein
MTLNQSLLTIHCDCSDLINLCFHLQHHTIYLRYCGLKPNVDLTTLYLLKEELQQTFVQSSIIKGQKFNPHC